MYSTQQENCIRIMGGGYLDYLEYNFQTKQSQWLALGIVNEIGDNIIIHNFDYLHSQNINLEIDGLLIIACHKGSDDIIKKIISMKPNIESLSKRQSTPLMFLAQRGNFNMVKYFIEELGADINVVNYTGLSALNYAKQNNHTDIVNYLLELKKNNYKHIDELKKKNMILEDKLNSLIKQMENLKYLDDDDDNIRPRKKPKSKYYIIPVEPFVLDKDKIVSVDENIIPMSTNN